MEFKAQSRTIRDALDLKRKYIIPGFQREYSWELEELSELWNDLLDNLNISQISYETFLNSLQEESADYVKISMPNPKDWAQPEDRKVFETLEVIDIFGVIQVRSFLLALFDVKGHNFIKHGEYIKILEYLQYFHFVFNAVCSERPSGLEQRYSSYLLIK